VIDLLGIGVWDRGDWRLRRLCARLEGRGLTAILADRRDERLALLDVVAGRVVPSEGRAWINGTPLSPETAARIRQRVGVVDLPTSPALDRTIAWNVLGSPDLRGTGRLGSVMSFSWLASSQAAVPMLERVGLAVDARRRASELDGWDRTRLIVARALRRHPDRLIIAEPDAHLGPGDVVRFLRLLRGLASRDRLQILVSLADVALAREAETILTIAGGRATSVASGVDRAPVSIA
jgi:ABC-type phosphate/phosphonate transport system ATPase subunit